MERIWLVIGVGFALTLLPSAAARSITLYPPADTYVDNLYPDGSFGTSSYLYVENLEDRAQLAYLMFDLSDIPSNAQIRGATLYLRHYSGSYTHPYVFRVVDAISETMTWTSRPSYSVSWYAAGVGTDSVSWDVTEAVRNALPAGSVSFCLAYTSPGEYEYFYSKDHYFSSYRPCLELVYNTHPAIENYQFSPSSAEWGSPFTFSARCSDPDGDTLSVTLVMGPNRWPMQWVGPSSYRFSWTPEQENIGTKSFYIEVSDGTSTVTSPVRTLTVEKKSTSLSLSTSSSEVRLGSSLRFQGIINPPITGVAVRLVLADPENRGREELAYTQSGQFSFLLENFTKNDLGWWKAVAVFGGNEYYKGSTSPEVNFRVLKATSNISTSASENLVRGDREMIISGTLNPPGLPGERITLSFSVGDSRFEEETTTGPGGAFSFRFEPSKLAERHGVARWTGEWRVTASWQGSETHSGSQVLSSFVVLAPLWVEQWFPLASALSAGLLGGLAVAVVRARRTYAPPPTSRSKERLVFEVKEE
jgi:hypothetical protein